MKTTERLALLQVPRASKVGLIDKHCMMALDFYEADTPYSRDIQSQFWPT